MGSVVDSLKRLYKKIGGGKLKGPIAVDDLVDKIADQMSSGGSSSGSNNVLMITGTLDTLEEAKITLDKTFEEIRTAYLSGKQCIIHLPERYHESPSSTMPDDYYSINIIGVVHSSNQYPDVYRMIIWDRDYEMIFIADEPNEYPHFYDD